MPEMPEIETIRRSLEPHIVGRRIENVEILLPRQIKWPEPMAFAARILQTDVVCLDRIGKYLILQLSNDVSLVFHLRMTGQLVYVAAGAEAAGQHKRLIIYLDDGARLVFSDTRTFGTMYAMHQDELWRIRGIAEMGPEPLSDAFTEEYLLQAVSGRKTRIKSFLLDQSKVGGLGNIYVDEALFLAGVHPMRLAGTLTAGEVQRLHDAVNKVIADGIADGGTTFRDYRDGNGDRGSHQEHLFVYGRDGQPCRNCGTMLEKIKVGGRGTRFCPLCQKLQ